QDKKRKMLIYGRPSVSRNCFPAILQTLIKWRDRYPPASKWFLLSLGETFPEIPLAQDLSLTPLGKATMAEYASHLRDSAIGLSLMVSPHPSYPPLEMAHFGVLTLTNNFANKRMESYHENLFTVDRVDPNILAD